MSEMPPPRHHPAGHVGHLWRRAWRCLSWAPPPEDEEYLSSRWWPFWRRHLQVRQLLRVPSLRWAARLAGGRPLCELHALRQTMDTKYDAKKSLSPRYRGAYRRRGHAFHWWCHGQLVGILLPGRRLVLGCVRRVRHTHLRRGWERRICIEGLGDVVYRQHTVHGSGGTFCWLHDVHAVTPREETILETWSLEPPVSIVYQNSVLARAYPPLAYGEA